MAATVKDTYEVFQTWVWNLVVVASTDPSTITGINGIAYLYRSLKCVFTWHIRNLRFPQHWLDLKLLQPPWLQSPLFQLPSKWVETPNENRISPDLHSFCEWSETTFSIASKAAADQVASAAVADTLLLVWRGVQQVIREHCALDPTDRERICHRQLIPARMIQISSRHVIMSRLHILGYIFTATSQDQKMHGLSKEIFSCSFQALPPTTSCGSEAFGLPVPAANRLPLLIEGSWFREFLLHHASQ